MKTLLSSVIAILLFSGFCDVSAKDYVSIKKANVNAISKTYDEIISQKPAEKAHRIVGVFRDILTISYGQADKDVDFRVQYWDPIDKRFPGWNPPVVDIHRGKARLFCGKLKEVGWPTRMWGAYHGRTCYLYVESAHRHRFAKGVYVYSIDAKSGQPKYLSVYFSEEELLREKQERERFLKSMQDKN